MHPCLRMFHDYCVMEYHAVPHCFCDTSLLGRSMCHQYQSSFSVATVRWENLSSPRSVVGATCVPQFGTTSPSFIARYAQSGPFDNGWSQRKRRKGEKGQSRFLLNYIIFEQMSNEQSKRARKGTRWLTT